MRHNNRRFDKQSYKENDARAKKAMVSYLASENFTDIIAKEDDGGIKKISISHPGSEYKTLPKVFMGGYIYYDTLSTGTQFSVGEVVSSLRKVVPFVLVPFV